ncbi:hypothetical protein [Yersinia alsatica]|uniref:hypothetical protein n=1 Tax=Yersinia alsatica TaxID=2890317 RepID=UPI00067C9157|nr:hypothetical protein [Yersinia alsatica]
MEGCSKPHRGKWSKSQMVALKNTLSDESTGESLLVAWIISHQYRKSGVKTEAKERSSFLTMRP